MDHEQHTASYASWAQKDFLIIYVPTGIQCNPILAFKQVISLSEILSICSVLREILNALLNEDVNQLLIYC